MTPAVPTFSSEPTRHELQTAIDAVRFWWHSIDLGHGVVTPGAKTLAVITRELKSLRLPDLKGKSVLDIGAYDGFYSFAAERLEAARVVALDRFVWAHDLHGFAAYWRQCMDQGVVPLPVEETPYWHPERLPGKRGFDVAHRALRSRVVDIVDEFITMDISRIGTFDIVLFLGVLYHMKDPLDALRRLAAVTRTMAVIETHAVSLPGYEHLELCEFYSSNQLNRDTTNWWGPNLKAAVGMCRAAGFSKVDVVVGRVPAGLGPRIRLGASAALSFVRRRPYHFRAVLHAWK